MNPLGSDEIRGNWATLLLPIQENDSIDYDRLAEEIEKLIEFQVDGIYSNGTAGEFYNQTEEEFDRISQLLAARCQGAGMPFQIGVSHMSPFISRERLKRVVKLQPSAVQVILPDWAPVTNEEAISFLKGMAKEAGGIGMVLYNPPHAKRGLSPEDFSVIKQAVPSLVGMKVAGGDRIWFETMKRIAPDISIFVPGHTLASSLPLGAYGSYSNVACLHPYAAQQWYRMMRTDHGASLEMESRIRSFIIQHIIPYLTEQHYSNQAVDKLLASIGSWTAITPRLRWPYQSIPEADVDRLRPIAMNLLPEFFP